MTKHLIFDFDGTISDSYPIFCRIIHIIAEENGLVIPVDDRELDNLLRVRVRTSFDRFGWKNKLSYEKFIGRFWELQAVFANEFAAFENAIRLLHFSLQKGKKLYIYTHSGDIVKDIMQNMGIADLFSYVLTADRGFPAKPAPDALQFLMRECDLLPHECMMIGDRPIDAQAGVNAGMCGVLWDPEGRYPDAKVDQRVTSLLDICDLI